MGKSASELDNPSSAGEHNMKKIVLYIGFGNRKQTEFQDGSRLSFVPYVES